LFGNPEEPKKPHGLTVNSEKTIETLSVYDKKNPPQSPHEPTTNPRKVKEKEKVKGKTKVFIPPSIEAFLH